jgi:hypothetical protein
MNMIYQSFLKGFFFIYIPKKILISFLSNNDVDIRAFRDFMTI